MLVSALDCLRTKTAVSSSGLSFQASSHWPCDAWCGSGASQSRSARAMSKPTESALALSSSWLASQRQAVVEPGPMPATRFGLPPRWAMTASSRDCCALQSPFSGGEVLDHPGGAVVSQVQHLGVVQLLFGGGDHHHPRARLLAGFGKGGVAAVVEVQGFQFRLGRRSAPEQQGGTDDQQQGGDQKTAPVTFHDRHISVSPIQSGRRRSARRYRPGPPAGRARLARPGSGVPSRAGTCP